MRGFAKLLCLILLALPLHACSDDQKAEGKPEQPKILPYLA